MRRLLFLVIIAPVLSNAQTAVSPIGQQTMITANVSEAVRTYACELATLGKTRTFKIREASGNGSEVIYVTVAETFGEKESFHSEEAVFYDPTNKCLYIDRASETSAVFKLQIKGKLMKEGKLNYANEVVPLDKMPSGEYQVVIDDSGRRIMRTIII